ncbi:unnamed protein product [Prunus armeniaca]|uniref:Uncharacterized protein n=1 Tax=Prunus armeniaca TaxID=36596 RepID=A0A6J5WP31_PRUAR|nr:unnamed protein product [Prunus armeniaca]
MSSSLGVRHLTVLGEFKPFGLIAEAVDGKPADNVTDKYDYFLFDPETVRERDETDEASASALSDRCDHELFIRGNRIIWSTGPRVFKRFTLPSPIIMACWCRLGDMTEALLCVLQIASLTIYNTSGEVVSVPLPRTIKSIWPLPFGLLLQHAAEVNSTAPAPSSSSNPLFGLRDLSRPRRESGHSPQHNVNSVTALDHIAKGEAISMSSHLILKDPLEEPHFAYIEERGKLNIMKEFDETTIWTSDRIPLMASYNTGRMQHSVWVAETSNSNHEMASASLLDAVPPGVLAKQFSLRRIWQGKGAHMAACKVFLATDDDAAPIICFLHHEQKKLLCVRLQSVEINNEILFDIKPDMSWSIPAVAAAPVIVTRPRVKVGLLPYSDMVVLAPENVLLLYSGKHCLCRYMLPCCLSKGRFSHKLEFPETTSVSQGLKIIGLADAVEGRINVTVNNGQMFRCVLRRSPASSLANDCITAMAEGLSSNFYSHFLSLLWKDGDLAYLSEADSSVPSEWDSFCSIMMEICGSSATSKKISSPMPQSSWEFLIHSKFHNNYCKHNLITQNSSVMSLDVQRLDSSWLNSDGTQRPERTFYYELLMESLHCLHAVYENLKLNSLRKRDLELLGFLSCYIAKFLGEESYVDHYIRDFPGLSGSVGICDTSISQENPPSLFRWLENCLLHGYNSANINDLPPLICKDGSSVVSWARKIVSFYSLLSGAKHIGKKLSSGVYCNIATGSYDTNEELTVLAMVGEKFGLQQLDSLPSGVSLPLRHALGKCRESPPIGWPAAAYVLLGREDLALSYLARSCKSKELETQTNVNLISMSAPYMLHLHPVTIPSAVSDTIGFDNTKFEDADSADGSMTDGMEHIFNSSTQLRYGRDLRLNEVRRLLCSARPVAIQTSVNPSASDQDLQQAQLWHLAQRTTALPFGRGAFTLATIYTLLTEAFVVPKLVLAGRLPAQQNATVNLDPNVRNIQEIKSWPEFNNAVAAGLRLAPLQEHEITTVGMMLGLAASYRGTMQPAISKSAGLMSVGLLYEGSAHPQTMQILMTEIGRRSAGDNVLEREGYAVSAGFALGLVALGRGEDALGFMDTMVDKLFHYIGGKEVHNDRSNSSKLSADEHNRAAAQMMDGTAVNVDATAPGATIALALMFLKTESQEIVSKLSIPHTRFELQYVRPDFIMLRVIARSLICGADWIQSQIPDIVKNGVNCLGDDTDDIDEMDAEAFCAGICQYSGWSLHFSWVEIRWYKEWKCSGVTYNYAVYFLNEIKPVSATSGTFPRGLSHYVDRGNIGDMPSLIVLSLSVSRSWLVLAFTNLKLLRFLRNRNSADGHVNYGVQMALLFVGGVFWGDIHNAKRCGIHCPFCFIHAFHHVYHCCNALPNAAEFIYAGAAEDFIYLYCKLAASLGLCPWGRKRRHFQQANSQLLLADTSITFAYWAKDIDATSSLKAIRICGPRYWPQVIDLVPEDKPWWTPGDKNSPFNSGVLYIKRKVGACSYIDDPIGCQSLLSRAMHKHAIQLHWGQWDLVLLLLTSWLLPSHLILANCFCTTLLRTLHGRAGKSDIDFQEFCLQVLFECVSKDRPALLQVYLSLYTAIGSMARQLSSDSVVLCDSLAISNLKGSDEAWMVQTIVTECSSPDSRYGLVLCFPLE